jgi:hypothetical protein
MTEPADRVGCQCSGDRPGAGRLQRIPQQWIDRGSQARRKILGPGDQQPAEPTALERDRRDGRRQFREQRDRGAAERDRIWTHEGNQ